MNYFFNFFIKKLIKFVKFLILFQYLPFTLIGHEINTGGCLLLLRLQSVIEIEWERGRDGLEILRQGRSRFPLPYREPSLWRLQPRFRLRRWWCSRSAPWSRHRWLRPRPLRRLGGRPLRRPHPQELPLLSPGCLSRSSRFTSCDRGVFGDTVGVGELWFWNELGLFSLKMEIYYRQ